MPRGLITPDNARADMESAPTDRGRFLNRPYVFLNMSTFIHFCIQWQ